MLQPFDVAAAVLDSYRRYVRSSFPLRDDTLDAERERLVDEGLLWAEPYVSLGRPGTTGPKLASLANVLDPRTLALPWGFEDLYDHQHRAIQRLSVVRDGGPANTLVLSGTGSGKTESFLLPIVDACLRDTSPGVKAVVLYPMNALANDQLNRLNRLLSGVDGISFGRYTGDAPETPDARGGRGTPRPSDGPANLRWSRQEMRDEPPSILLTNYTQLEYLLLRRRDRELFRHGPPRYLVVDEIHLFTGVLGAEVACLLRRFRQHTGAGPAELCMVGTSATAGTAEEQGRLLQFAERFFGAPFGPDAAIAETPVPIRPAGPTMPPAPSLTDDDLRSAASPSGLATLAAKTLGVRDLPTDESLCDALGAVIDTFAPVGVVEQTLGRPAPVGAAADALAALPERAGVPHEDLEREVTALVLLGAAAHQRAVGEDQPEVRFRPRVHQVVRSLAGLWRCLDPSCGRLLRPGEGACPACGSRALPLATCRTCGEAFWTAPTQGEPVAELDRLRSLDGRPREPRVFLADPARLASVVDTDEEGARVEWSSVVVCPTCAVVSGRPDTVDHDRACPRPLSPGVTLLLSGDAVHCPSCGDLGARNRPILLPLQGSAAASVAVLTQSSSDELRHREGEAGGRLLVFADSRQDAAQQAGYADDQGARVAVRQLVVDALGAGVRSLPDAIAGVQRTVVDDASTLRRWLIGESDRDFAEIARPDYLASSDDETAIRRQLEWEVVLDVTERARRRFSLEQEGLVIVGVDRLGELASSVARQWPAHPFGTDDQLAAVLAALVDVLRHTRAVDHPMLRRTPRQLSGDLRIRIGDRGVTNTRGFAARSHKVAAAQVDLRGWTSPRNATRVTELIGRVLGERAVDVNEVVDTLVERLRGSGLLASSTIEGRRRDMVDHKRLAMSRRAADTGLWRCDRCGAVRATVLRSLDGSALCTNWRCTGRPVPYLPAASRDFYRRQYEATPRRLILREHSGQIESEERLALEERFNDRSHPTVDVLACTPTLEVGVSLDDLHAVLLRNLPPTPANYAQRVGRAGRRSKVAVTFAHAGHSPHDSYFFERPSELIAGLVKAPAISLENEPLLRRHVNSLVLETLGLDLPTRWVPPPEDPLDTSVDTIADADGVLLETTMAPFAEQLGDPARRAAVEQAVRDAFQSVHDPSPPAIAAEVCRHQLDQFLAELRAALNRWCQRYRSLLDEYRELRRAPGVPTRADQELERRLLTELQRLAAPRSPEFQPLGFLGLVGFLPRYGFTGDSVLLVPPGGEDPIVQSAPVAVTEFAPGNVVYARGRKLKVRRLDPAPVAESEGGPDIRENLLRPARRCDACELLSFDPLVKSCPSCGVDLVAQDVVVITGVRGSGKAISSDDEYRTRADYDVAHVLGDEPGKSQLVTVGGFTLERFAGREVVVANRGPVPDDGGPARGFDVCTSCGFTEEAQDPDEEEPDDAEDARGHFPRCPGRRDPAFVQRGTWLVARFRGDVLEVRLPDAARTAEFASWRATVAEALLVGVRETMQAGQRDLGWFERLHAGVPHSIVLFDTMPGGTGYLPKLLAGDAAGLKDAAAEALARLSACSCADSCHRCLRDFWNQRLHHLLDRFQILGTLRRLTETRAVEHDEAEDDRLESFLEVEFFARLAAAGIPAPTLQVTRELGRRRVTRVDAEWRSPDVSVFLDGREYHAMSTEKIADDIDRRNRLDADGVLVLELTYGDVMDRFDEVVVPMLQQALTGTADGELDPRSLSGIEVTGVDERARRVAITLDAVAWAAGEVARREALTACNRLRLAGWRLQRSVRGGNGQR
jgi:ATP-dependent helicase YprA (DUF1998 family)